MPVVYVDTEQAELLEASCSMLEAALSARVKRQDPDLHISNSLALQASKLATFRAQLKMPAPPPLSGLAEPLRRKAIRAATQLSTADTTEAKDAAWEILRGLIVAAGHQ